MIENLKKYAENNVITHASLKQIAEGTLRPVGDNPAFVTYEGVYRLVYCIEEQPLKSGKGFQLCSHLSISCKDNAFEVDAITDILEKFGFDAQKTMQWREKISPSKIAWNFLQVLNPSDRPETNA